MALAQAQSQMRRLSIYLSLSSVLALAVGCTVAPPDTLSNIPTDGGTTQPPTQQPDMTPDPNVVDVPVLDPVGQTSVYDTVPIHGVSDPNTTVLVETMDGQVTSVDVDQSGRFCIDLPLQSDKTNKFQIAAINSSGTESATVPLAVRQQGTPAQAPTAPQPVNMAIGGNAQSYRIGLTTVDPSLAIDGDRSTWTEGHWFRGFTFADGAPLMVAKLQNVSRINKIVAVAPTDCAFGAELTLYFSSLDAPSPPDVKASDWVKVPTNRSGDTFTATSSFNSAIATHIAAMWTWPAATGNCGWDGLSFGIAELQAWSVPNQAPPPPAIPSCTSGY